MSGDSRGESESVVRVARRAERVQLVSAMSAAFPAGVSRLLLGGAAGAGGDNVVSDGGSVGAGGEGARASGQRAPRNQQDSWYRITNMSDTEAEVLIYDEIGFWGMTAEDFIRDLRDVRASTMTVRLNSPGGSVFDGIAIANALYSHPANVTVYVDGLAASIASVIAMSGDRVVMMPRSQMMIHDASGLCMGNATDMAEMAALLDKQSDNIAAAYADRAGGTAAEWRDRMRAESWYTAEEAVAAGLADEVAPPKQRQEAPAAAEVSQREQLIRAAFRYADRDQAPEPVPVLTAQAAEPTDDSTEVGGPDCEQTPAPVTAEAPSEPEPEPDPWLALTAHLTQPAPDPWAGLVAHLTSSSAATSTHA